jgi:hypothetical protein
MVDVANYSDADGRENHVVRSMKQPELTAGQPDHRKPTAAPVNRLSPPSSTVPVPTAPKSTATDFSDAESQREKTTKSEVETERLDCDSQYSNGPARPGGEGEKGGGPNQLIRRIETTPRQRDSGPYENVLQPDEERRVEWKQNVFNGTDNICSPTGRG